MDEHTPGFCYTYSPMEQEEIKRIRQKYLPPEEDKMEQLRRLDRSVTHKGTLWALTVGVLGVLLLGTGMSCTMVLAGQWFLPGVGIGLAGIAMASTAYPLYVKLVQRERERLAPEILRLTEELMK